MHVACVYIGKIKREIIELQVTGSKNKEKKQSFWLYMNSNVMSDLFCTSSTLMLFSSSSLKPGTSTTNTCPPSVPSSSSSPDECARTAVTRVTLGGALSHHKGVKMKALVICFLPQLPLDETLDRQLD